MNAQEARKKAMDVNSNSLKHSYEAIKKCIGFAVNDGELSITINQILHIALKSKLLEEGFKIDSISDRDGNSTTISW
jgi:hypothetical protein